MLEVREGKIFVEGVETIDAELIGMAFKDFAEGIYNRGLDSKFLVNEESNIIEFRGYSSSSTHFIHENK